MQQNCPPLLIAVLTLPCETKSHFVHSSNVCFKSHDSYGLTEKHYSKCSVFAFGFETRIKTTTDSCLINEALLVADYVSIRC